MNTKLTTARDDFPILQGRGQDFPLTYLDNGATTQKPRAVIEAITHYYETENANVHRGAYHLAAVATHRYDAARTAVRQFIHARHDHEIIFVRGCTEALNLLAFGYGARKWQAGDEIILSMMEHHANLIPWQVLAAKTGAVLRFIPLNAAGELDLQAYQQLLNERTRLVAVTHVSNVLGTINPIAEISALAHAYQIPVIVDGAQAVPHLPVDVQALDCDFYVFSSHKMYGPMGIGVLYGKEKLLESLPPYQTGGGMISEVTLTEARYQILPAKLEAGTPNVAGAVGLQAAIHYLQQYSMPEIAQYEQALLQYAKLQLAEIPGLKLIGAPHEQAGVLSFVIAGIHPHDIATALDSMGIAVRAGHHCAMPLMEYLQLPATTRISLGIYNTQGDIDRLIVGLEQVVHLFKETLC